VPTCYYGSVSALTRDFCLVVSDASIVNGKTVDTMLLSPPDKGLGYRDR
jgi:hypothetical protein